MAVEIVDAGLPELRAIALEWVASHHEAAKESPVYKALESRHGE